MHLQLLFLLKKKIIFPIEKSPWRPCDRLECFQFFHRLHRLIKIRLFTQNQNPMFLSHQNLQPIYEYKKQIFITKKKKSSPYIGSTTHLEEEITIIKPSNHNKIYKSHEYNHSFILWAMGWIHILYKRNSRHILERIYHAKT